MVTRYNNLSGVDANYVDGSFANLAQASGSQSVLLVSGATKGRSNTPFLVRDLGAVSAEFGSDSQLVTLADQLTGSSDVNVFVSRVGGSQSHFIIKKDIEGISEKETLIRISPRERNAVTAFEDIAVAFLPFTDGDVVRQRLVMFNTEGENVIFDSEEIFSQNDTEFEVELNNDVGEIIISKNAAFTLAHPTTTLDEIKALGEKDPRGLYTISDLDTLDALLGDDSSGFERHVDVYNAPDATSMIAVAATISGIASTFSAATLSSIAGNNNLTSSHCKRFAAVESMYADIEDVGVDYMFCDGCYADVKTIPASGVSNTEMTQWENSYLGTAHRNVINGQPYLTMFASPDPLKESHVVTTATTISHGGVDVIVTPHAESTSLGLLLTLNDVRFEEGATITPATLTSEEYFGDDGRLKTVIRAGSFANVTGASINAGMFHFKINTVMTQITSNTLTNFTASTFMDLSKCFKLNGDTAGGVHSISNAVLTHHNLTGELVPEEALDSLIKLDAGKYVKHEDAYAREVSFAHQAASMAYTSSTEYKSTISVVPTTRARGGLRQINAWAGKAPEYAIDDNGDLVVETNGSGLMGTELLYGNTSYRTNVNANGLAYGGLIQTKKGFGIDSSDELLDERDFPVDIGKHLIVVGAYGVVQLPNAGNRANSFGVSNLGPKLIQKLLELPVQEEPIGPANGRLAGVSTTGAINSRALLNDIALGRVVMIGTDGSIANLRTAALPSSDYTRVSTIRAVNLVLDAVRSISLRYLGRAFSDAQLAALDAELAGTMRAITAEGAIQTGSVQSSASRLDRINGRLNLRVQVVPPLSIEAITIDLVVSAPQA